MSFGIHLLVKGTAKSNAAVLNILQAHVDEMDGFVSRTSEDFLIIQVDLRTRIQYLSLPLENLDFFDEMLVDRNFRMAMIDYNDKIDLAIQRFTLAINDALKDIQKGKEATSGLWQYLGRLMKDNIPLSGNLAAIYDSMLANTEGWNLAFSKLRKRGTALLYAMTQLGRAIAEMQRRVGVASRREVVSTYFSVFVQFSFEHLPTRDRYRLFPRFRPLEPSQFEAFLTERSRYTYRIRYPRRSPYPRIRSWLEIQCLVIALLSAVQADSLTKRVCQI
jgi:hypothetical protein